MQIDRTTVSKPKTQYTARTPSCPLECKDCTGLCLSVYMMLTPQEQDAVYHLSRVDGAASQGRLC